MKKENKEMLELLQQVDYMLDNKKNKGENYQSTKVLEPKVQKALQDLDLHHNNSLSVELLARNLDNLDNVAIFYRGNKITYKEMFTKAFEYARSLKALGYGKGSEIPVCVSNIPEFVYLFLAIGFIGAKINSFGEWFDENYSIEILNHSNSDYVFVSDDIYPMVKDKIQKSNVKDTVMFSLTDSLLKDSVGIALNPYDELDQKFHSFQNNAHQYQDSKDGNHILLEDEFVKQGVNYHDCVVADCCLDDDLAITYTSGTTNPNMPKAVLHPNRSYLTLSRFKESDVSGMPSMRNLTILAHIPTYTHMQLSCAISDTLFEKCTLAMEPFYNEQFFPYSLMINQPNFVPASAGFYVHLCKLLNYDEEFKKVNMPYLMLPTVTGEACSPGEEKFFNYTARKHKFGTGKLPFPLAPVTFSIGGGTSESSGIFVTLFKALREKSLKNILFKETLGLTPLKFADVEVLDENGEYCSIGQPGLLVANSPCSMKGYYYQPELNNNIIIHDKYGKSWYNLGTYSYKSDKNGRIKMKGRMGSEIYSVNGEKIPYYYIEDIVLEDTKNILSCSLIKPDADNEEYVCHIELQPNARYSVEMALESCANRLTSEIPKDILDKIYFRVRDFNESFSIAPSGKRDYGSLIEEGITDQCLPVLKFVDSAYHKETEKVLKKNL